MFRDMDPDSPVGETHNPQGLLHMPVNNILGNRKWSTIRVITCTRKWHLGNLQWNMTSVITCTRKRHLGDWDPLLMRLCVCIGQETAGLDRRARGLASRIQENDSNPDGVG